jgi:hypothetical protein
MNGSVGVIMGAFFIIGITFGIAVVIALSLARAERGETPVNPGADDTGPAGRPRWPGDAGHDITGS